MPSTLTTLPAQSIEELLASPQVHSAFHFFEAHAEAITTDQIAISSIPAPPFAEKERAEYLSGRFQQLGLDDVAIDKEGNCVGLRKGTSLEPLLVVSAHLDTVFPAGTDVTVRNTQGRLFAPGIADDACGLAALIAIAQALGTAGINTEGSILFVGTVGEEGQGNLRGVRYLFAESAWANRISAFISFDGPGSDRVINRGLGSRRYRVSLTGPGGHSWSDFGVANPVHALGRAIARLVSYPAPREPRTTFNVGRIEGGASINAIPGEAMMDVDLRSSSEHELRRLDAFFRRAIREAVDDENGARSQGVPPLHLSIQLIGERPSGETPRDAVIVALALESARALGFNAQLDQASTDANLPISLGVPAITLGAGGASGNSHTLEEWYDPSDRASGLKRGLLVVLGLVGLGHGGAPRQ
jgi:tripeptide aminopeptidase